VDAGETFTVPVVALPAFELHVYVVAPLILRTELCPAQIAVGVAEIERVGVAVTFAVIVSVEMQFPFAPVSV
jgi:hypothetical protein